MSEFIVKVNVPSSGPTSKTASHQTLTGTDAMKVREQSTLTTHFIKSDLEELLNLDDSHGIRLYPAMSNGKATLLAVAMNRLTGDLVDHDNPCFLSNGENAALRISVESAKKMMNEIQSFLSAFQTKNNELEFFKAVFTTETLKPLLTTAKNIQFDIARLEFSEGAASHKTLTATSVDSNKRIDDKVHVSLLPCPPHCGVGGYLQEIKLA